MFCGGNLLIALIRQSKLSLSLNLLMFLLSVSLVFEFSQAAAWTILLLFDRICAGVPRLCLCHSLREEEQVIIIIA